MNAWSRPFHVVICLAVLLCCVPSPSAAPFQPVYTVKIVGTTDHNIDDLNNLGQFVGSVGSSAFSGDTSSVSIIAGDAWGGGINDYGVAVVTSEASNPLGEVTLIPGGGIGICNPSEGGYANAINNSGVVVGVCYDPSSEAAYYDGTWHYLPQIDETLNDDSRAIDVNDDGIIVGWSRHWGSRHAPAVWVDGAVSTLPCACGVEEGHSGAAYAINNAGHIVGAWSSVPTLWNEDWVPQELPRNGNGNAWDINECGWIVGEDTDGPVLWRPDSTGTYVKHVIQDLLDETGDLHTIQDLYTINDFGWMAGMSSSGACVLIPSNIDWADSVDSDEDGLWDKWEICGIDEDDDGVIDLRLKNAGVFRKDLYVELDADQWHLPPQEALDSLVAVFARAPVSNPTEAMPTDEQGISIHFVGKTDPDDPASGCDPCLDDEDLYLPGWDYTGQPCEYLTYWGDFDTERASKFGSELERNHERSASILAAKELAFRYGISAYLHRDCEGKLLAGRAAGIPSNHFYLALGGMQNPTAEDYAGILMHELGHTLGLLHGGNQGQNRKPNYYSVMNYTWDMRARVGDKLGQIAADAVTNFINSWRLDYSTGTRNTLNEELLIESEGIGGDDQGWVPFGVVYNKPAAVDTPIVKLTQMGTGWGTDWNLDSTLTPYPVVENINFFFGLTDADSVTVTNVLTDVNDWELLQYLPLDAHFWYRSFSKSPITRASVTELDPELEEQSMEERERLWNMRFDCNANGIYDDEEILNGDAEDGNGNGIPDVCESDSPTPVTILGMQLQQAAEGIYVRWSVDDGIGYTFSLYRESAGQPKARIAGGFMGEGDFSYLDTSFPPGQLTYTLREVGRTGKITWHGPWIIHAAPSRGVGPSLAYPNPLRAGELIRYTVPQSGRVRLMVYGIEGDLVSVVMDELQEAGPHEAHWNGLGINGRPVAAGMYFLRLNSAGQELVQKVVLRQ